MTHSDSAHGSPREEAFAARLSCDRPSPSLRFAHAKGTERIVRREPDAGQGSSIFIQAGRPS